MILRLNLTDKDLNVIKKALEKSTSKVIAQDILSLIKMQEEEQKAVEIERVKG